MKSGWEIKRLDALCEIARGGSPRPIKQFLTDAADGVNWVKISDASASSKYIYETKEKIKPAGIKRSRIVHENDFLLSNSMSFGRPYIMKTAGCIHDGWLVLKDKSGLFDQNYLYHFLSSDVAYKQFESRASGSTVRNLNIDLVKSVEVILPPLPEQRRIVAILDEAFAAIATATANAEKNLAHAQELFESELNRVFAQRGEGWDTMCLSDLFEITSSKRVFKSEWKKHGVPFYRAREIVRLANQGYVDNELFISEEMFSEYAKRYGAPKEGDLMVTGVGTLGICYVVRENDRFYFKDGNIIWLRKNSTVNSRYIEYSFRSTAIRSQIDNAVGATVGTYTIIKAKNTQISIPSVADQEIIVAKLDDLKKRTKRLESIYQQKLTLLAELKQSLLHKAFSGELTADAKEVDKTFIEAKV